MHISFVILHYITIDDTKECVESILNNVLYDNYSIVIVDNGSNNFTGEKLLELYRNNEKINIIINNNNTGFARGNNVGFMYAKNKLGTDAIVMINNDTIITQKNFCEKIKEIYNKKNFDICGPNVISKLDGMSQNPIVRQFYNKEEVNKKIVRLKILLFLSYFNLDQCVQKKYIRLKKNFTEKKKNERNILETGDFQLHGCCMIFSKKYINKYNGIYDKTFMYGEEDILRYICQRDNLNMIYSEELNIYHKEYSSTYMSFGKGVKKRRFYYVNSIESYKLLQHMMSKNK